MVEQLQPGQFYGETRSIRIADAILSEVTHRHPRDIEEHLHAMPFFLLLLDGGYAETSGTVTINYSPLTVGFHSAARGRVEAEDTVAVFGCGGT